MPVPLPDSFITVPAAPPTGTAEPLAYQLRHVSDSPEEAGADELSEEEEHFFDTQEFVEMESEWSRGFNLAEDLTEGEGSGATVAGLVARLRAYADRLERLSGEGWEMEDGETAEGNCDFMLRNNRVEREQWRLRRHRRRERLAEERRQEAAALAGDAAGGERGGSGGPEQMETDDVVPSAGGGAPVGAAAAPLPIHLPVMSVLKSPQRLPLQAPAAFALF